MEFGVFATGTVGPKPWDESEPRVLRADVQSGIVADEAGFDTFWAPEHHCTESYSHSSSSHLTCLAVGLQTKRIRVVTGIMNLCPTINHPVRVAEQIALIDILTDGRVELGTGRGSGSTEVNTFGLFNEDTRELWEEAVREIPKMWTRDLYSHDGKHFSVPERCILPKPIQKPHPPMWVTSSNPETVAVAGRMGLGVAVFSFQDPLLLRPLVDAYKRAIEDPDPVGEVINNKFVTIAPLVCLEDGDLARKVQDDRAGQIDPYFATYFDTIPLLAERTANEPRPIPQSRLRELVEEAKLDAKLPGPFAKGVLDPEALHESGICAGTPDEVARTVGRYQDVGIDQLVTLPRLASWMEDEEQVWESMRLFGKEVIPRFKS
ncbi:MAG: LLM class flavin-dependent oxidoreductase [Deltaproteobacteria bacterium]|nr:LLM class flavin-dependent oxidoreductase [Deltaproteobacteria bacterium]